MKVALYTCVTNAFDVLRPPSVITDGVDYLCFNDGSINVPAPWIDIRIDLPYSGRDANRYIKILPHGIERLEKYDLTIYVDGAIAVMGDLTPIIEHAAAAEGHTFMYMHPLRSCVYSEARACVEGMKAPVGRTASLVARYRMERMPENFGLFEGGIIVRKRDATGIRLMQDWWSAYLDGVQRDQLALMYSSWRTGIKISSLGLPDHRLEQRYFACNAGHSGDLFRRLYAWWVWRPMVASLISCRLIKL